jgi:Cu/Ag efflux pump CusA
VTPALAPDANELGQIYWYTLAGGGQDLGELRALQDSYVRPQLAAVPGVLADSAIVMTEHAHVRLHASAEGGVVRGDQREVALRACLRVGRPLFFSVLITMASFLPVLALGGMEGRLFRPLALTKLFALAAAAVLAVTLVAGPDPHLRARASARRRAESAGSQRCRGVPARRSCGRCRRRSWGESSSQTRSSTCRFQCSSIGCARRACRA